MSSSLLEEETFPSGPSSRTPAASLPSEFGSIWWFPCIYKPSSLQLLSAPNLLFSIRLFSSFNPSAFFLSLFKVPIPVDLDYFGAPPCYRFLYRDLSPCPISFRLCSPEAPFEGPNAFESWEITSRMLSSISCERRDSFSFLLSDSSWGAGAKFSKFMSSLISCFSCSISPAIRDVSASSISWRSWLWPSFSWLWPAWSSLRSFPRLYWSLKVAILRIWNNLRKSIAS